MTLSRRRFLTLSAAFACSPSLAHAHNWQGTAFGADVTLTIRGPRAQSAAALSETRGLLREIEALFSLYDPQSSLVALNQNGQLQDPDARFLALMDAADTAHTRTKGLFDPTVQPLWAALAQGRDTTQARAALGWDRVQYDARHITLDDGQALTFNGIAQGYATDVVTQALSARGLDDVLVNIGEYRSLGGPWKLGISDPVHGQLGTRTLHAGAIATSSPAATPLGRSGHILHRDADPKWSTVTVEATSATIADSLSTAMVLADRNQIAEIAASPDIARVTLVDFAGNLTTL